MADSFTSLATFRLASPSRLFAASCCPDKDLLVLVSRLAGVDRMGLWHSSQGFRVWEIDIGTENGSHIVDVGWSPDGQSIAVACDPPSISFHSIQDGRSFLTIPFNSGGDHTFHLTGIWWFRDSTKSKQPAGIPDIFRRGDTITGSALSILKLLPLLDNLEEDSDKVTATDLFAFQGSHTRAGPKSQFPSVISTWPTLSIDSTAASISSTSHLKPSENPNLDEVDTSNIDSLLLASDDQGRIFCYLDGTFPLGHVSVGLNVTFTSFFKHPTQFSLIGQTSVSTKEGTINALSPAIIRLPLLQQGRSRELTRLSSICRELVWFTMRVVKQMREAWFGSETHTGARELGPRWIQSLISKQKEQFGLVTPNAILDLTSFLTTGRATESLQDFLGSSEQMSERGIQKWESTVTEALVKLRDFGEKRIAPACQRVHLLLNDLLGWAQLPEYAVFELSIKDIKSCLELVGRAIIISSWLAAVSRRELLRFREFISWLRYETSNMTSPNEAHVPRHDILEVHSYFETGLVSSPIDKWFMGPEPQFEPEDLGISMPGNGPLDDALRRVQEALEHPELLNRYIVDPKRSHDQINRNLDTLILSLAERCQKIFAHAAGAASRSAIVSFDAGSYVQHAPEEFVASETGHFRKHVIVDELGRLVEYTVVQRTQQKVNMLLLIRLQFGADDSDSLSQIGIALLECYLPEEEQEDQGLGLELLEANFIDDESVVVGYRLPGIERKTFIATVYFRDLVFHLMPTDTYVRRPTLEDLTHDALELWKNEHLDTIPLGIERHRLLNGFKKGGVSFALNGRVGRRVACVLDNSGTVLETIDLEGDAEDMEVADETRG